MSKKLPVFLNPENDSSIEGMYKEYFLDYASYVILERAVPAIEDGLKPVQRRILHSMKRMDDGRYHKVANVIGQTMQYHPHGDAAIGAALVNLGQKELLIDTQGNWGDYRTGDSAAAPRYIEARLTKFANEVLFNPQTTEWQMSYDGRNKEPVTLPVKFPLVLTSGVEGIAVGLATKILPHNFIELIKASIKVLRDKPVKIYPDFLTGGMMDVSDYNHGKRGGKIKVRARIEQRDKSTLAITELPFAVTVGSLVDSILKANEKGQIKIKKVIDNTAKDVEILLELQSGVSPDVTIDALYAFSNCEVSISPNAVIIREDKPVFLGVEELLKISTENTKDLLRQELEIKKAELEGKWHNVSLEKIFIENRIYRDIEEAESWEQTLEFIAKGLKKYVATPSDNKGKSDKRLMLHRDITEEDIIRLTEIKIKRISKYNKFKADELLKKIEEEIDQVVYDLKNLTDFAVAYFENLLQKYGKGKERRTEITEFDTIKATRVVAKNAKLYVNYKDGFVGTGLKKDEFIEDCSDIDDVIAFTKDGKCKVVRIGDKVFIGSNIIHAAVWKKGDDRTTYNMVYVDAKTGRSMAKRFNVKAITRDKEYDLTKGNKGSKVHYFSANPNGESETVNVQLTPACAAKKKVFDFDFDELGIKGRASQGNILTKYPIRKVTQLSVGKSSLGAQKLWMDEVSGRLNKVERGKYLGAFDTGSQLIALYKDGTYEVTDINYDKKFEADKLVDINKFSDDLVISAVYFDGDRSWTMVKRFQIETNSTDKRISFITENNSSKLYFASLEKKPEVKYSFKAGGAKQEKTLDLEDFIEVKGYKALGNKLGEFKILKIESISEKESTDSSQKKNEEIKPDKPTYVEKKSAEPKPKNAPKSNTVKPKKSTSKKKGDDKDGGDKLQAGDIIEFDF